MKNFIKLFVVVLAVAFVFISCEKGGTIEVLNQAGGIGVYNGTAFTDKNIVKVVKFEKLAEAAVDVAADKGTLMTKGETKKFNLDEDGMYVVVAKYPISVAVPPVFNKSVTLLLGNTEKVTIK